MAYLSTDLTGRYLLRRVLYGQQDRHQSHRGGWERDGSPVEVVPTGKNAHAIRVAPSNTRVLASNLGSDQILQFAFDPATGRVTPGTPDKVETAKGAGPRHFVFSPDGRFVFGTTSWTARQQLSL